MTICHPDKPALVSVWAILIEAWVCLVDGIRAVGLQGIGSGGAAIVSQGSQ